uniref:Uncharacterized protein n=1 Tax=Amorphochlora amoebiformis TaxID=1561963 RepID=A0A0H5BKW2_9EUKA|nr:hypothetical protein [Amorphochlora amoebiformis]
MTTNLNMLYKSRNEIFFTNLESFFSWKTFITNKHILFNIQIYIILRILYSFKLSYCLKSRLVNAPAHQNVKSIYSFKAKTLNKTQTDIKNDTKYYKFRIKKMKYLKIYYWKRIKTRISSG